MQIILDELDAAVTNINLRREKHGDDRVIAVDLNVTVEVSPKVLDQLSANTEESFEKILYSDNGNLKQSTLDKLEFNTEFENHVVKLNSRALEDDYAKEFDDAKLVKFKAIPKNGHIISLTFQIQLHPSEDQIHWLTDGYSKEIWIIELKGSRQAEIDFDDNEPDNMAA